MAKQQRRFLALLRGINVGGNCLIAKDDLRQCFEDLSFANVRTYIQSGNVLFEAETTNVKALTAIVEEGLSKRFSYEARAVILSHKNFKLAVAAAPDDWGNSENHKHNAMFTLHGTTPQKVLAQIASPKADIETVTTGPGVIFWSASTEQLTKTTMLRLPKSPIYKQMTIRNHNTVFKLLELFEAKYE